NYAAGCDETAVNIGNLDVSDYADVTVNGIRYEGNSLPFEITDDVTEVEIIVTAETGGATNSYTLTVTSPVAESDASDLYVQRWDNILAINRNPAHNGGIAVSDVRWYGPGGSLGNSDYIRITGAAADYYAEIKIGDKWHRACASSGGRSIEQVTAYPNPVSHGSSLTLQLPESFVGGTAAIYDISGSAVKSKLSLPVKTNSLDVSDLASGIYLIRITGKNGNMETVKIIVE
ncbi:MAG: T9SS type A sorting domain-containing protein, partial [Prevotellaceae bacterium]|nr:T9SS type A sorting domain-containing protein [Prevotellaceae bacterium]